MLLIFMWINTMFRRTNPKQKLSRPGFKRFKRKQIQKYRQPAIQLEMEHRASVYPPGDLPDPGIEHTSLMSHALAGVFFEPPFFLGLLVIALCSSLVDRKSVV